MRIPLFQKQKLEGMKVMIDQNNEIIKLLKSINQNLNTLKTSRKR